MRPDGHVLLAQRPAGKPYEGWWEFPGGKFEPGENAEVAVTRELEEELGIRVLASSPWVVREHVYEHAHVRLFFRRITAWEGEPRARGTAACLVCARYRQPRPAAAGLRRPDPLVAALAGLCHF